MAIGLIGRRGLACAAMLAATGAAAQESVDDDLLTLARGAVLISASVDPAKALSLTDGDDASSWSAGTRRTPPPYVFVFELIAPAGLTSVGVAGAGARPGGVAGGSAGPVQVEGSADGPDTGFRLLAEFSAAPDGRTLVPVASDAPVRWLRFTVGGGQTGDEAFVYLAEAVALGLPAAVEEAGRFDGIFASGRSDLIELHQDGTALSGCFTDNSGRTAGTLTGGVQDGVAFLQWQTEAGIAGSALLTRTSAGALSGVRYRDRSRSSWGGPRAPADARTGCSVPQAAAASPPAPANPVAAALETDGTARIYGILFDHDSDRLRPEAGPALERLRDALAGAAGLSVTVEGHTDATGADDYNLALSARRAEAVVAWLVAAGIDAGRLDPVGLGEAEPVASNATADGRALNRRVEVTVRR